MQFIYNLITIHLQLIIKMATTTTTTLDIVKLIEKNPISRLTKDYQNNLINKIKAKFSEGQQ